MSINRYHAIFVSPHLDDAVLSAGNQLRAYVLQGKSVLVVTVFTKGSPSKLQAAKSFLHQSGFSSAQSMFNYRKEEDIHALRLLGAKHLHLAFTDAGFRADHPTTNHIFKSSFSESDHQITSQVSYCLSKVMKKYATNDCHVFAPLAVGNHIDHEIVYSAVCQSWKPTKQWRLSFWEDVPYRHRTGETCTRLAQTQAQIHGMRFETTHTRLSRAKLAAINCYKSQVQSLANRGGYCQTYDTQIECYWHA